MKIDINKMMKDLRRGSLPSSEVIVKETFDRLGITPSHISKVTARQEFNNLLFNVFNETLYVLEEYEGKTYARGIAERLISLTRPIINKAEIINREKGFESALIYTLENWYIPLRKAFLSISQSRKTRGGRDFELQFGYLLELAKIPYRKERRSDRVDFLIPLLKNFSLKKI